MYYVLKGPKKLSTLQKAACLHFRGNSVWLLMEMQSVPEQNAPQI